MHELILTFLGPFAGVSTALICLLTWRARRALCPRHVLGLALLCALGLLGFFLTFFAMWAGKLPSPSLGTALLYASGSLAVGCGSSVLFATTLLKFGHSEQTANKGAAVFQGSRDRTSSNADQRTERRKGPGQPSSAELISEEIRARKRRGLWMSGVFLLVAMPSIAAAILFSLSNAIQSGYMTALRVVNQANPGFPKPLILADAPSAFAWQTLLLGAVAGLCLYWASVAAYHLMTGFRHHPDYPR
jgi:hypothetical protein